MVLLVVLLLVAHVVGLTVFTLSRLQGTDALGDYAGRPADSGGTTWLLVGSDTRSGLTRAERAELHTGSAEGQRTDTIILLHAPRSGPPTLVSLPRDSYVEIAGGGRNKLNSAYASGGAPRLVRTVEQATGLRIDSYVEVGFGGVVDITDAVGGVDVCVRRAMKDEKAGLDVKAGCQELDGATALAYVRARYSDPKGDLGRIERQQQYLAALISKLTSKGVLLNPVRQWRLSAAGTGALATDGAGPLGLTRLVRAMRSVSSGDGVVTTVPVADTNYRTAAGSTVRWDERAAAGLFEDLRAGRRPSGG
ncbi:LCP family protein [Motilibacter sp. E257]|uniref:LCP family protein n=1 Tax=Motilibacter deserti TaxID=2714956 RepID=A0ABX0GY75_9ACTN|nr:LCP family protein [Motilibacter deserti]